MNRLIAFLIAAVLLWAPPAPATFYTHVHGTATLGQSGHAIQGLSVYVYDTGTTDEYEYIYSDMAETQITQPTTTDANGFWEFYIVPEADVDVYFYKSSLSIATTIDHYLPRYSAANAETVTAFVATDATITDLVVNDRADADTLAADVGRFRYIGGLYDNYSAGIGSPTPFAMDSLRVNEANIRNVIVPPERSLGFWRKNSGDVYRLNGADISSFSVGNGGIQLYSQSWLSIVAPDVRNHNYAESGSLAAWLENVTPEMTYASVGAGDTLYGNYNDNGLLGHLKSGSDTSSFYQCIVLNNSRDDSTYWGYFGPKRQDLYTQIIQSVKASPNKAFGFQTNLPDSNGVGGEKTILEIKRNGDHADYAGWLNPESAYLELVDGVQTKYAFQRDYLRMYGDGTRDSSKNTPITLGWYEGTHRFDSAVDTLKASIVPSDSYKVLTLATTVTDAYVYIDDLLRLKPRAAPADTVGRGGLIYFSNGATPHLYILHGGTWHQLD